MIFQMSPQIGQRPPRAAGVPNGEQFFETAVKASQGRVNSPTTNNNSGDNRVNNKRPAIDDDDDNAMTGDGDNSNSGFSSDIYRNRKLAKSGVAA